ncbi:MAG TPA: methionine gamma-lyase family protein [Candidatus Avilachnospira avistercoris]|nr:methionine gamma-lyase family protein [Candidatus Avilachnospira avistercoris]
MSLKSICMEMGISPEVYDYCAAKEGELSERFREIDEIFEYNQIKVLRAMQEAKVSEACLVETTGYGYNDMGRDRLEEVYAKVFKTEDALVRSQIVCGTHALATALFGNTRPGDEIFSPVGLPYDTLLEVLGVREAKGSLKEYGVSFAYCDLLPDGSFDFDSIRKGINERTSLVTIQRSRGYSDRHTLSIAEINELIEFVRSVKPAVTIMVDNCYGEFIELTEPSEVGADMVVGSLIKNPGGGIAPVGGYIAGTKECVQNAAARLTAPGLYKELGPSLGNNRLLYQGLFMGPSVAASAEKGAVLLSAVYGGLGFECAPDTWAQRDDIIEAVTFHDPKLVMSFCRGVQRAASVDSFIRPEPTPTPGYAHDIIMAAGCFISGSSIELSADGPLREPYTVYFQGGLTYPHSKFGVMMSLQQLIDDGFISKERLSL